MSKALVIKGANFSENKVDTVHIIDIVPCTGIVLSQSEIEATAIGATYTLTATVTPIDTTDQITWGTSDENVVTVNNGVVTVVGVGEATITAYCGTRQATCNITSTVTVDISTFRLIEGYSVSSTDLNANPPKDYVGMYASSSDTFVNANNVMQGFELFPDIFTSNDYPISIPSNATKVTFEFDSGVDLTSNSNIIVFVDAYNNPTYIVNRRIAISRAVTNLIGMKNAGWSIDVPDGANGFAFSVRVASAGASITGNIVFS